MLHWILVIVYPLLTLGTDDWSLKGMVGLKTGQMLHLFKEIIQHFIQWDLGSGHKPKYL